QAEDGIRDFHVTGVQTCALPILRLLMKTSIVRVLFLWLLALPAVAGEAALAAEVNQVKRNVLELNRELYQLEQDLLSPATTRLALYLSLQGGEYFEPLALEIRSETLPPVLHI